jgi:hypothetical protein
MDYSEPLRGDFESLNDYETHCAQWRAERCRDESAHVKAWRASPEYAARPFRFENLNGKPEPEKWGPCYPKTASAAVEKWRKVSLGRDLTTDETRAYGQAVGAWIRGLNAVKKTPGTFGESTNAPSGQKGEFSSAKHRAKMGAEFVAAAARDRRNWALGESKDSNGHTIEQAYKLAMIGKAGRLAREHVSDVAYAAVEAALFGALDLAEAA